MKCLSCLNMPRALLPCGGFRLGLAILGMLVSCGVVRADSPGGLPEPRFDPPPRLAISAEELAARRTSPEFPELREKNRRAAEVLLEQPPELPNGPGSWIFYYANPENGNRLVPISPGEHKDPATGKIFTDERTCAAYRTVMHGRADAAALTLAWAYADTGDERFAAGVRRILHKLAGDYSGYPNRHDRWGRRGWFAPLGGRRYVQSLDEATGVIKLAKAYDLTRTASIYSEADRAKIEKDFFRATADTLLWFNQGISNHQTWYNAGLMAIASVLADGDLARRVVTMRGGVRDQLVRSVDEDGFWYEGTMAYHNYALQARIETVEAGRRMGWKLDADEKFRRMFTAPLRAMYPNGVFPAINDSDRMQAAGFDRVWRWAWETWKDPVFAQALARGDGKKIRELLGPDGVADWPPSGESEVLAGAGLVVLRMGSGTGTVNVFLDYGPHGGGHGHFDKLNLLIFANGREWMPDTGRLTYSHKVYKTWVKTTVAHNTVTINGRNQAATAGELVFFQQEEDFAAAGVTCDTAYPGVRLTRRVMLTREFLVDVFEVAADRPGQVDLVTRVMAAESAPVGTLSEVVAEPAGNRDGYQHLSAVKRWDPSGDFSWDFTEKTQTLRGYFLAEPGEKLFSGKSIGYTLNQQVPFLIRRRQASKTQFVVVYDLSGDGSGIKSVSRGDDDLSVVVETSRGNFAVRFDEKQARLTTK